MTKDNNLYVVTGLLYSPSGWEYESDCYGSEIVRGLSLAKRVAKLHFFKGGVAADGRRFTFRPTIKKFDPDWDNLDGGAITYYNSKTKEGIYL